MMGRIVELHGDRHQEAQSLLPWYVTGQLDPSDQAQVEAHLLECPECQAELKTEHRLKSELADLPFEIEHGWTRLRGRLDERRADTAPGVLTWLGAARRDVGRRWRAAAPGLGWALAAAQIVVFLLVGVSTLPSSQPARYRTLGAAPAPATGNVVVIFRPDTSEADLRATLKASHARLVDGPTAADAYVLHVPAGERLSALARLREKADIELAEPIDAGDSR
ncbi:MAG: zf-HC2 domain-containing protein [Caulobacteraceae bacterium]